MNKRALITICAVALAAFPGGSRAGQSPDSVANNPKAPIDFNRETKKATIRPGLMPWKAWLIQARSLQANQE
ncbi:MAG: hypothetical protein LBJ92_02960 [Holosporales bacterium]|nr:hypothetical protein [Holosporales bacterium]